MLSLVKGHLDTNAIFSLWQQKVQELNFGALSIFVGIVRAEDSKEFSAKESNMEESNQVSALSFEIYEPLLAKWFESWQQRAKKDGAMLFMAHSIGKVKVGQSSYMSGITSSQRKIALSLYSEFVEDFKANAPIWKYDIVGNQKIYAKSRSKPIAHSGLLG